MTFMTRICHLCVILHYILKFDCGISAVQEIWGPKVFKSNLVATLTLIPRPSKLNPFSAPSTTSSIKVWCHSVHWFVRYRAKRTHARPLGGQIENNASATPLSVAGRGIKMFLSKKRKSSKTGIRTRALSYHAVLFSVLNPSLCVNA